MDNYTQARLLRGAPLFTVHSIWERDGDKEWRQDVSLAVRMSALASQPD